jgi:phage-related protein (TIGR01555 family)
MAYKRKGGWGGRREGAGPPRRKAPVATVPAEPKPAPAKTRISIEQMGALVEASQAAAKKRERTLDWCPYRIEGRYATQFLHPKAAMPAREHRMASDSALVANNAWAQQQWLTGGLLGAVESEGLMFLGYPLLSELAQRPEFRVISETIATEMTRKGWRWKGTGEDDEKKRDKGDEAAAARIAEKRKPNGPASRATKLGDDDKSAKIRELRDMEKHLQLVDRFCDAALYDGLMGRSHLFLDDGKDDDEELKQPLVPPGLSREQLRDALKAKVGRDWLKRVAHIEPMWVYPMTYNASNPLALDWYNPQVWYVMGRQIHRSRIPTFIGRPVPDLLKPAYSFGGLSLTQMAKPYVDIWVRTRESVADLVQSYATMVLLTDLSTLLAPGGGAADLIARIAGFTIMRDNQGMFVANKESEDVKSVAHPIAGLHELKSSAHEDIMSVARIPAVKFTGMQPQGLNATSDGELRAFDETIGSYQGKLYAPKLDYVGWVMNLSLWGEIDDDITHEFVPLEAMSEKEEAELEKMRAETASIRIGDGVIDQVEERQAIADDPKSRYPDIDVDDVPDLQEEEDAGLEPGGKRASGGGGGGGGEGGEGGEGGGENVTPFGRDAPRDGAADEFREAEHPRDDGGKFTAGSGGGTPTHLKIPGKITGGGGSGTFRAPQLGLPYGPASHPSVGWAKPAGPRNIGAPLDASKLTKVGAQMGSNPGGVFEDADGKRFYVKKGKSPAHVRNEMVAAALYGLAGSPTLKYRPVEGGGSIATEMSKLSKDNVSKLSKEERREAQREFAVHAWLGNWDAVGLGGDNIGTVGGVPTALDLGGALEYRAQGGPKGKAFGDSVGELDSLRDPAVNGDSAGLFGKMTPGQLRESARLVTGIPDDRIRETVKAAGGDDKLAEKLVKRKADIAERARRFGAEGDPKKPTGTMVVPAGEAMPVKELNGVPFKAWRAPSDWAGVDGQIDLDEPEFTVPTGKKPSSGVIVREADGRIWLVQPRGGFGGYEATFPKGGVDAGLSLQANAIKEAYEESGLKVRITGHAGDHEGDTSMTRYYYAEREAGDPSQHDNETEGVVLAPAKRLDDFLNRARDRKIAEGLAGDEAKWEESKHPRDPEGKFSSTGVGGSVAST